MKLFHVDADRARAEFARQGYVHIRGGVTPEFLVHAGARIRQALGADRETVGGNATNKEQFRFEMDDLEAAQDELFQVFGHLSGLDPTALTLSERHVNAYRDTAVPAPVPHKDRRASQVTVGLSIEIPEGSHLVLWPALEREENCYESAADLYAALPPASRPEQALQGAPEVVLHDRPGDVVVFAGSTTWHCRRNAAGTVNLFFKLNDFGDDPLGEDARAGERALAD